MKSRFSETPLWSHFHSPHCENQRFSCMGFLRDVAMSRQSKRACSALNFRNVIEIKPLRGFFGTKRTIIIIFIWQQGIRIKFKGTSINCLGEANSQYPLTYSVGCIKQIHLSVSKARALKNVLIESLLTKTVST